MATESGTVDLMPAAALDAWLKQQLPELSGEPTLTPLAGGASNLTWRVTYPERTLIVRRPPPGQKAKGAHDMQREYSLLKALEGHYPLAPKAYAWCGDLAVIGAEFLVMQCIEGRILRRDLPKDLSLSPEAASALCEAMVSAWAGLHDAPTAALAGFDRGEGYVARQIGGWAKRYTAARTPDVDDFADVIAWLTANAPPDAGSVLIHNDFRLDNLVLDPADPTRIVGVLDWEMATLGDPWMDLGAGLAYWIEAGDPPEAHALRLQPSQLPGMWTRQQIVERYAALRGLAVPDFRYYLCYGWFRLAGIAQQIYYRHYHGQFRSERFAGFGQAVNVLAGRCRDLMG